MSIEAKVDLSVVFDGLDKLGSSIKYSLARSMAVAGGQVVRDEAKTLAPVESGRLKSAIYLAYRDGESTDERIVYSVSWNSKSAPHGHLLEFGHWRYNKIIKGVPQKSLINGKTRGSGPQDHGGEGALDVPVWVPAHPFLRPALDATRGTMVQAMIQRGRKRLPELLRDAYTPADEEFV